MVFQETSLVPSMTVAQNLYLGSENFLNRLRGIYISAQQFLQSLNFRGRPDRDGRDPRCGQAPDGRDRPRGASQCPRHHLRRADRHADAGGEASLLRAAAAAEGARRVDRLHQPRAGRGAADLRPHHHPARWRVGGASGRLPTSTATRSSPRWSAARCRARSIPQRDTGSLRKPGRKVLSVQDISMGAMVRNTSFSVFEGQITGVFGLIGSGRTETFKIVAGINKRDFLRGGTIDLDDRPVRYVTPAAGGARRHRLRHRGPQDRGLLRDHVDRPRTCSAACWRRAAEPGACWCGWRT